MSQIDSFALLADFAQLVKKHGSTAFSELATLLKSPEMIHELTTILEAGSSAGRKASWKKKAVSSSRAGTPQASIARFLSEMKRIDPEKASLLSGFYEDLSTKRVLSSLRDLREFAHDNHVEIANVNSREKAFGPLLRELSKSPTEQLQGIIARVAQTESVSGDRSLERWADVILDKDRTRK